MNSTSNKKWMNKKKRNNYFKIGCCNRIAIESGDFISIFFRAFSPNEFKNISKRATPVRRIRSQQPTCKTRNKDSKNGVK